MATKKVELDIDGAKKTVEVKEPPKKTCALKDVLPASVIPLIAANPKNPTIRALLLAHLKQPVPDEHDTFEAVKDWIEHNIKHEVPEDPFKKQMRLNQEAEDRRRANSIQVAISADVTERGRCSYAEDKKGEGNMPIDRERIVRLASESDNPDDFFERVESFFDEEGPTNHLTLETLDTRHYDEEVDYDDEQTSVVQLKTEGKNAIRDALRAADQELYNSLFGQ